MKNLLQLSLFIILIITTFEVSSQTYDISTNSGQTISTCTGTFYDSGGPTGGYVAAQTDTITFCPSTPGAYTNLNFTAWSVGSGDNLEIFDGADISSPSYAILHSGISPIGMSISATLINPSGCLTLKWTSSSAGQGWAAGISCGLPCQNYNVGILSSTPPFYLDSGVYFIDLCPYDTMSITATGIYNLNDSIYHQSDATTSFMWDMDNFFHDTIQTVTTVYDTIRGYNVGLTAIDSNGCLSAQSSEIRVRLSTLPSFNGTTQIRDYICEGDTTSLFGISHTKPWQASSTINHIGQTYLPDGSGASYTSTIVSGAFAPGQVLQNENEISAVRATLEHSYLGDLNIKVTCPNGQFATLKSYPGGSSTFLGEPIDNNAAPLPGIGYEYAWMPTGTTTMLGAAGSYTHSFTDVLNNSYSNHAYLPPSTGYPANSTATGIFPLVNYLPDTPFTALVGCPLNGTWTINITDNLMIDNGFIFAWGIDFVQVGAPISWTYQPSISSQSWNSAPSIIATNGGQINIMPDDTGSYHYTYSIVDNFGCSYDTSLIVNVLPIPTVDLGNDTIICSGLTYLLDAGAGNFSYLWSDGSTNQIYTADSSGIGFATDTIFVMVHDSASCSNFDTILITFNNCTSINSSPNQPRLNVYPNPSNDFIYVEGINMDDQTEIFILNSVGMKVSSFTLNNQSIQQKIDISFLPKGVFFLHYKSNETEQTFRILKM